MIGPAGQRLVAGELRLVAGLGDFQRHRFRDHLLAVELALVADHLSEAGEVAQCGVQSAAAGFGADRIHHEIGVVLGAELLPDFFRQQVRQRLAGRALDDPRQHLGVGGLVGERLAVLAFLLQLDEEFVERARAGIVGRQRHHAAGARIVEHFGLRIGVVLRVFDADGHIHHFAHGGVAVGRVLQLGDILDDLCVGIELAFRNQHRRQRADEGFRHRKGDVRLVRIAGAEIFLVDDLALVQHQQAVGIGQRRHVAEGDLFAVHGGDGNLVDVLLGARQLHDRAFAARDVRGRRQFADVAERPARAGEFAARTVAEAHDLVRRRRKTLHDLVGDGIGLRRGRQLRRIVGACLRRKCCEHEKACAGEGDETGHGVSSIGFDGGTMVAEPRACPVQLSGCRPREGGDHTPCRDGVILRCERSEPRRIAVVLRGIAAQCTSG